MIGLAIGSATMREHDESTVGPYGTAEQNGQSGIQGNETR